MTTYRVLKKTEDEITATAKLKESYSMVGTYDAHSPKAAIQQAVHAMTDAQRKEAHGATFAATPDGSWTETTVGVAVETKVTVA